MLVLEHNMLEHVMIIICFSIIAIININITTIHMPITVPSTIPTAMT